MGEKLIPQLLNIQKNKKYKRMNIINPYAFGFVDESSNVFLGTVSNLWSNPANWSYGHIPTSTEKARIHANCSLDIAGSAVNTLQVDNGYTFTIPYVYNVVNKITVKNVINYGTIVSQIYQNSGFVITGDDSMEFYWGTWNFGTQGGIQFSVPSTKTLTIPNLTYGYLYINGAGTELYPTTLNAYQIGFNNTSLTGITINTTYKCESQGSTFTNCLMTVGGLYVYNDGGIYINDCTIISTATSNVNGRGMNFGGTVNNYMYFKNGGISIGQNPISTWQNVNFIFQEKNQSYIGSSAISLKSLTFDNVEVTNSNTGTITTPVLNGTTSTSKLINKGTINYTGSVTPMATGILDCSSFANTFNYYSLNNLNILSIDYWNLVLGYTTSGANEKTILSNIHIKGNLSGNGNVTLNLNGYNFTIDGGVSMVDYGGRLKFKSSGNSNIIIKGYISARGGTIFSNILGSNNIIELQGGGSFDDYPTINSGTTLKFTTNNQTFTNSGSSTLTVENVVIDNIVLTSYGTSTGAGFNILNLTGLGTAQLLLNGTNTTIIRGDISNVLINTSVTTCYFNYLKNGNQNIAPGTYGKLTLGGTATPNDKTLQGNVSVLGTYTVSGNAVRVDNGFTFGNP